MSQPSVKPRYVPVEVVGAYCSVSRTTVYAMIRRGEIHSSLIGARRVVDLDSVDEFLLRSRDRLDGDMRTA